MISGDMGNKPSRRVAAGRGRLVVLALLSAVVGYGLVGASLEDTQSPAALLGIVLMCVGPMMAFVMVVVGVREFVWARSVERDMAARAAQEPGVIIHPQYSDDPDCSAWEGSIETQFYFAEKMGLDTSIEGGDTHRRGERGE
jgi:hypothetical protein